MDGCGNDAKSLSCPYHGWTYGLDGSLVARPDDPSFAAAERATHGLRALPITEKYGMIWVGPRPGMRLEVDGLLDGVARDLADYALEGYHHYETRVLRREMNWKLAVDTFCETYHLSHLHPDTVGPLFHTNRATFDAFGRNHRLIAARRTIDELRGQREDSWNVFDHTAMIYVLFPNPLLVDQFNKAAQRGGLARAGGPDDQDKSVRLVRPLGHQRGKAEFFPMGDLRGDAARLFVGSAGFDRVRAQ